MPAKAPMDTGSSTGIQYIETVTKHLDSGAYSGHRSGVHRTESILRASQIPKID